MWGLNPSLLGDIPYVCEIAPTRGLSCQGWGFWQDHVSVSPTHLNLVFLPFAVKELFSVFSGLFQRIFLSAAVDLVCSWEQVSSCFSYTAILIHPLLRLDI